MGVNDYRLEDERAPDLHRPDPAAERRQADRLAATRAARDDAAVEAALAELRRAAAVEGENLMPRFIAAARARASEGEMVATLQEVFGTYTEHPQF